MEEFHCLIIETQKDVFHVIVRKICCNNNLCFTGEHGISAIAERCDGERLQYRHVPETVKSQRRIGLADIDERIASDNLGRRSAKRET